MIQLQFEGIDYTDYPDFCDAYVVSGTKDGVEMTEEEIESLSDDFIYECLMDFIT